MPSTLSEQRSSISSPAIPRWARAVDLLCLLLVVIAAIVSISGGFRQRFFGVPLSVRSPYPLLIWALAVGVVRHLAAPQTPVYRDLPGRLSGWARLPGVRTAAAVVVGTRPAMFFVGYLAVLTFGYAGGPEPPMRHFENELMNLPARWDANWYLQIVTDGYSFMRNVPDRQQNIVFFPAYPMLVRGFGRLLGGHLPGYFTAGTLISLGAFFAALIYLYALARDTLADEETRFALWLIGAYPFAFFFGAIYTESLFLLGVTATFYHFTKAQFGRASVWGLLVGLTRPNGCFLSVPLALLAVSPWLPPVLIGGKGPPLFLGAAKPQRGYASIFKPLLAAAMPGIGMLIYAAYIWWLTGDPLAWEQGHLAWGRRYQGLGVLLGDRYDIIAHAGLLGYVSSLPHDVLNALGVAFVLVATWPVARRLGLAYAVFILINILPPLAAGGFISAGRFSAVLFPAFIWMAGAVPPRHRAGWIATFAAVQAFNAALFYTWRPLY